MGGGATGEGAKIKYTIGRGRDQLCLSNVKTAAASTSSTPVSKGKASLSNSNFSARARVKSPRYCWASKDMGGDECGDEVKDVKGLLKVESDDDDSVTV